MDATYQSTMPSRMSKFLAASCLVGIVSCAHAAAAPPDAPAPSGPERAHQQGESPRYLYLDVEGAPLPVQDHEGLRELLLAGEPVAEKPVGRGIAGVLKLTLQHEGVRFHAAFRTLDRTEREAPRSPAIRTTFRDSHLFELAAYLLDRRLGLHRIPPTVRRTIGDRDGTLQLWLEGTTPETVLIQEGRFEPPDRHHVLQQKRVMWVFDSLVANVDRNQGNVLIDGDWDLWFIDHTRAFRETASLLEKDKIDACERRLWRGILELDEAALRELLGPYLLSREIAKLELRRQRLVKHISKLIERHGEDAVLFDLQPPGR